MSDNWIRLVPEDPRFVPARDRQKRAQAHFWKIAPSCDEIELVVTDTVQFFDCGGNFERILCPACSTEIPIKWWWKKMDEESAAGFPLNKQRTPCCGADKSLNELKYEWPQAFGRFCLEAMNPNIGKLKKKHQAEIVEILGCPLRVIYQHI